MTTRQQWKQLDRKYWELQEERQKIGRKMKRIMERRRILESQCSHPEKEQKLLSRGGISEDSYQCLLCGKVHS